MSKEINTNPEKTVKKDIKNLKVNYIDIENFKNIEGISTELSDINIIWWFNWNGKSSFSEAMLSGIKGQNFYWKGAISPSSLVKVWENKATIRIKIKWKETEISIERIFTKWTAKKPAWNTKLTAEINWEKISQASLNELLNTLTLDPLRLWTLSKTEQIKEIKNTTWLDTEDIDKLIIDQEESRKESRIFKDKSLAFYEKLIATWTPEKIEEVKIEKLFEAKNKYVNVWNLIQEKENTLKFFQEKKSRIEELKEELKKEELNLEKIKEKWKEIEEKITTKTKELNKKYWSNEKIDEQIEKSEEINQKAKKYQEYLEAKKEKDETLNDFKKEEEKLEQLRSDRTKIIANSNLPKYMEISEDYGILVDGTEYKLLNTAKKIEIAIDLILISWSPLRLIRIENGAELDTRTLEKIKPKILEYWFQLFLERAIVDKFDTIIIDDWEIVDNKEDYINNQ